ncbi:MAG: helix-turn-helix domain-containing protein, partial [Pseudomonas sp.]
RIGLEDLPAMIRQRSVSAIEPPTEHPLEDAERLALLDALERQRWHMTHTAEQLGISRNTLYRKLRKHAIAR